MLSSGGDLCFCVGHASIVCFFFQAEDGIRDLVRSRGLGDVYKRQLQECAGVDVGAAADGRAPFPLLTGSLRQPLAQRLQPRRHHLMVVHTPGIVGDCLLYTSDAADERSSGDPGGRRILKKKNKVKKNKKKKTTQ